MHKKIKSFVKAFTFVGLTLLVGFAGSLVTTPSVNSWFRYINKPFFSPPNWVFAPVWTALYILMGFSAFLVWQSKSKLTNKALSLYLIQLGLNFVWSFFFFYLQNPLLAFFEIIILWLTIVWTMAVFKKISPLSFKLLLPYLAWVSFATILNLGIVIIN